MSAATSKFAFANRVRMAAEHLPHVFDRFYRSDPSHTKKTGGFGLGLALVKSIMTLHGGEAKVASELGKGTTVTRRFPPARAAAPS
jgi:signal transduction histidine kinase